MGHRAFGPCDFEGNFDVDLYEKTILKLFGGFEFLTSEGRSIAPKSAKSRTLLALLATSQSGSRGRLWLQKRLWPDSDAEKAAMSLRQALSEIRRALGAHRELLWADRRYVGLDLDRIGLVAQGPGEVFLEDVGGFAAKGLCGWLEEMRQDAVTCDADTPVLTAKVG